MKKILWLIGLMIIITIGLLTIGYRGRLLALATELIAQQKLPPAKTAEEANLQFVATPALNVIPSTSEESHMIKKQESTPPADKLPKEFNLAVPFTSQAPYEDWSMPYKEACEEASVMMVDAFYQGRKLTKESAKTVILNLVDWQLANLGHWEDTDAEETARILREKYGYKNVRVVYNITIDDIKREVAQGRPVIIPAAGQLLKNRYFHQPGPLYHMLVVRGWTKDGMIITNDPGTKRGNGYLYKPEVLLNAIHDWNGGDVLNGKKVMIVVKE